MGSTETRKRVADGAEERLFALSNPLSTFIAFLITESLSFSRLSFHRPESLLIFSCRLSLPCFDQTSDLPPLVHVARPNQQVRIVSIARSLFYCLAMLQIPNFSCFPFHHRDVCAALGSLATFADSFVRKNRNWLLCSRFGCKASGHFDLENFSAWLFSSFLNSLSMQKKKQFETKRNKKRLLE
jgi:hypothetical protein